MRKLVASLLVFAMLLISVSAMSVSAYAETPYRIEVDITNQIVTIFSTSDKSIVRQMLCSSGADGSTPLGTYTMPSKTYSDERSEWYYFPAHGVYAKYASRVYKGIMFHSIPYNSRRESSICKKDVEDFGTAASHGCIRLRWEDAEFIAKNCLKGTRVKFYESGVRDEDLRELLKQSSYTGKNGQTYNQFLGIPEEEGVLGRFSKGDDVRNLQLRLRDLGVFADSVNGEYRATTVNAVKQVQAMLDLEETGYATLELQEMIYSNDAPVAMNVTLKEGMSGPAVKRLQENLATLKLYEDSVDGVYDVDVIKAVKLFQSAYGYDVDGVARTAVQKAICYEAGKVKAIFALDEDYEMSYMFEEVYLGRISSSTGIRLRKSASTDSAVLARLTDGDVVFALEYGDPWSKVQYDGNIGYIKNVFAKYYIQDISSLTYTSVTGGRIYNIGYTVDQYRSGIAVPSKVFDEYLASGGSLTDYEGIASFATVSTEEGISLNLRETPSTSGVILAELANGTQAKVIVQSSEWSYVNVDGREGYLLNDYLEFWKGPEDALDPLDEAVPEAAYENTLDNLFAVVKPESGGKAPVYDVDSEDAEILGYLNADIQVEVVRSIKGWSLISYQGHEGYMKDSDLHFVVGI